MLSEPMEFLVSNIKNIWSTWKGIDIGKCEEERKNRNELSSFVETSIHVQDNEDNYLNVIHSLGIRNLVYIPPVVMLGYYQITKSLHV